MKTVNYRFSQRLINFKESLITHINFFFVR